MPHVPHLGPTLQLPEQSLQRFVSQELALCVHPRGYKNYFHWIEDRGGERKSMGRAGKELSFVLRSLSYKDTRSVFPNCIQIHFIQSGLIPQMLTIGTKLAD